MIMSLHGLSRTSQRIEYRLEEACHRLGIFSPTEIYLCAVIFLPNVGSDFEMKLDYGHTLFFRSSIT